MRFGVVRNVLASTGNTCIITHGGQSTNASYAYRTLKVIGAIESSIMQEIIKYNSLKVKGNQLMITNY